LSSREILTEANRLANQLEGIVIEADAQE